MKFIIRIESESLQRAGFFGLIKKYVPNPHLYVEKIEKNGLELYETTLDKDKAYIFTSQEQAQVVTIPFRMWYGKYFTLYREDLP